MPVKHDWEKAKSEYIEGIQDSAGNILFPTLQTLSERHKISFSTIRKRSALEDWTTERNIFRSRLEQKRREMKSDILAGKASEFDAGVFRVTEIALSHIKAHFVAANYKLKKSEEEGEENLLPMSINSLEQLSKSLERFQKIGRIVLGEPTDIGGETDGERSLLIRELVKDPEVAERIEEYYRSSVGNRFSKD